MASQTKSGSPVSALQRGRTHESAETKPRIEYYEHDTQLQRGRTHESAETEVQKAKGRTSQNSLQRGRTHESAETGTSHLEPLIGE